MSTRAKTGLTLRNIGRRLCTGSAVAALAALSLAGIVGCGGDDEVSRQFRAAAMGSIESGVKSIADGILTGIFTVADPTENASASNTTTGG